MSPINLNGSRILITNDDGYNADGIKILYELAKKILRRCVDCCS